MNISEAGQNDVQILQNIAELTMAASVDASADVKTLLLATIRSDIEQYLAQPGHCFLKASEAGNESGSQKIRGYILVKDYWHLSNLFVLPEHHSLGIGSQLLAKGINDCKQFGNKGLITVNSSLNAVRFYRSRGFVDRVPDKPIPAFAWPMQLVFEAA